MAATGAMMKSKQMLKMHIQGALNSGASPIEVKEVLSHISSHVRQGPTTEAVSVYSAMGLK